MAKPGVRPLRTSENGKLKYELIASAHSRIQYAITKGFHIEAIAIIESVLADRLESAIVSTNPEVRIKSTLGSLVKKSREIGFMSSELADDVQAWHDSRSKIIHEMVKLSEDVDSTWKERIKFARITALDGVRLIKEVDKMVKRIKRKGS